MIPTMPWGGGRFKRANGGGRRCDVAPATSLSPSHPLPPFAVQVDLPVDCSTLSLLSLTPNPRTGGTHRGRLLSCSSDPLPGVADELRVHHKRQRLPRRPLDPTLHPVPDSEVPQLRHCHLSGLQMGTDGIKGFTDFEKAGGGAHLLWSHVRAIEQADVGFRPNHLLVSLCHSVVEANDDIARVDLILPELIPVGKV